MKKVLVVGTFRSGTNVAKYCLETHFGVRAVFNEWFWKHGLPPTGIRAPVPRDVPILVMSKEPADFVRSLYRFWRARRPELDAGANVSEFVRSPLIVYDNSGQKLCPMYRFASPMDYWNQFYFAWMHWARVDGRQVFLKCEDMMADPGAALSGVAARFGLEGPPDGVVRLPPHRVGPPVPEGCDDGADTLTAADRAFIEAQTLAEVADRLGYRSGA